MQLPDFILGVHDEPEADALPGDDFWTVISEETGINARARGRDYTRVPGRPIVRLNYGYCPRGTLPQPRLYEPWADTCASWVATSSGCSEWIIANEWNLSVERPHGHPICPPDYARAYKAVRRRIKALPGHANDLLLLAAVGPWNTETPYPANPSGDWIAHLLDVLYQLHPLTGGQLLDGLAIHTYTRANDPACVTSEATMGAPFSHRRSDFRQYRDQLEALPAWALDLPVFITECCPEPGWNDAGAAIIAPALQDVHQWNAHHRPQVRALCFYRWRPYDRWHMPSRVKDTLRAAIAARPSYRPTARAPITVTPPPAPTAPLAAAIAAVIRPEIRIYPGAALHKAGIARGWEAVSNEAPVTLDGVAYIAQEWEDPATAAHYYLAARIDDYGTILVMEVPPP